MSSKGGTHGKSKGGPSSKDSMMLWNQLVGDDCLHDPQRDGSESFLFYFPGNVRQRILGFVGFEQATVVACVNREHTQLLDNDTARVLVMQKWALGSQVVQSIEAEQKMGWFDFGIIMLSLVHQLASDLFQGRRMPAVLQDIWVEAKLNDFFCHESSVIQLLGIEWGVLSSNSNFTRTLQNAMEPETVHDDNAFSAPNFLNDVIFFGHWGTGSSAVFLGLWIGRCSQHDAKQGELSQCPVVEWNYSHNSMQLTHASFDDFIARGARVAANSCQGSSKAHSHEMRDYLSRRSHAPYLEDLEEVMDMSDDSYNSSLRNNPAVSPQQIRSLINRVSK